MANKKTTQDLYDGKFFYEIVKPKTGGIQLFGPFDNILYLNRDLTKEVSDRLVGANEEGKPYKFVQVVDGRPVVAFTEEEILVTDRKL